MKCMSTVYVSSSAKWFTLSVFFLFYIDPCGRYGRSDGVTDRSKMIQHCNDGAIGPIRDTIWSNVVATGIEKM